MVVVVELVFEVLVFAYGCNSIVCISQNFVCYATFKASGLLHVEFCIMV